MMSAIYIYTSTFIDLDSPYEILVIHASIWLSLNL